MQAAQQGDGLGQALQGCADRQQKGMQPHQPQQARCEGTSRKGQLHHMHLSMKAAETHQTHLQGSFAGQIHDD